MVAEKDPSPAQSEAELSKSEGVKHPLEHSWSIWMFTNTSTTNWTDNLVQLSTFDTVEDYWCHYHHMKTPSELQPGQDYALFKKYIRPMWEDEENKHGGRWLIIPPGHNPSELDRLWLDVVLLLIGESCEHSDLISGAVVNFRSKSKINLWTRTQDRSVNFAIGKTLKRQLNVRFNFIYCRHDSNKILLSV